MNEERKGEGRMRIWMTYSQSVSVRYTELMLLFYFYRLKRFISVYPGLGPKRTQSGWKWNCSNVKHVHGEHMSLPKAGCFHSLHYFVCFPSTAWKHILLHPQVGAWQSIFTGFPANLSPCASPALGELCHSRSFSADQRSSCFLSKRLGLLAQWWQGEEVRASILRL